jgi:hypothetical protein
LGTKFKRLGVDIGIEEFTIVEFSKFFRESRIVEDYGMTALVIKV